MVGIILALFAICFLGLLRDARAKRRAIAPGEHFFDKTEELALLVLVIVMFLVFAFEGGRGRYGLFFLAGIYWSLGSVILLLLAGAVVRLVLKPRVDRY